MRSAYNQETPAHCGICKASRSKLLCSACANSVVAASSGSHRHQAAQNLSGSLQDRLDKALKAKEKDQKQQEKLAEAKELLLQSRAKLSHIDHQRSAALDEVRSLRQSLEARRLSLRDQQAQLPVKNAQLKAAIAEQAAEADALTKVTTGPLASETRERLGLLMEILPLTSKNSLHQSQGDHRQGLTSKTKKGERDVFICGCQLPISLPSQPLPASLQERQNAGLGYIVLLIEVICGILHAPLLFQMQFEGSTSGIWLKRSFWRDAPPSKSRISNLYLSDTKPSPSTALRPSASSGPTSTFSALKHRLHLDWDTNFRGTQPGLSSSENKDLRNIEDYKLAVAHLHRNIGVLGAGFPTFPSNQPPFAALLDFCWQIAMRPRTDHIGALSVMESALIQRPLESLCRRSLYTPDDFEDVDGWDVVQRPFQASSLARSQVAGAEPNANMVMPPAPSENDEVIKHWEKAHFSSPATPEGFISPYLRPYNIKRHVKPLGKTAVQAADYLFKTIRKA